MHIQVEHHLVDGVVLWKMHGRLSGTGRLRGTGRLHGNRSSDILG